MPTGLAPGDETKVDERRIVRLNLLGFGAYCLAVLLFKWFGFTAAGFDHAKEIFHAQEMRWVYDVANPPLYTWLLHGFQQLFGVRLSTVLILNQLLLFLIFASSFVVARRVLRSPVQAALAAWSLMLVGHYHKLLYSMSHSLLVAVACALAFWLVLRMAAEGRLRDYVAAGVVIGIGLLSKYIFLAALLAIVAAALADRSTRRGVLDPKFGLTLVIGAAIFAPFVIASDAQWSRLIVVFQSRTGQGQAGGYLAGVAEGLASLAQGVAEYAGALVLVAAYVIVRSLRARGRSGSGEHPIAAHEDEVRFAVSVALAGLALIVAAILAASVSVIKPRFLHVFLYPLPILTVALVARHAPGRKVTWHYAILLTVVGAGILAMRIVNLSPACLGRCPDLVPFDRLSERLVSAGFRQGTIFANGVRLGGNMVLRFPDSHVDVAVDPFRPAPPPAGRRGQCLIIWERGSFPDGLPKALLAGAGLAPERALAAVRSLTLDWRWHGFAVVNPERGWRTRRTTWRYILLAAGTPSCR
jgi:hypothetical protein